jgi:hypothetical protein
MAAKLNSMNELIGDRGFSQNVPLIIAAIY